MSETHDLVCLTNILRLIDEISECISDGEGKFDYDILSEAEEQLRERVLSAIAEIASTPRVTLKGKGGVTL